jgi:hypothetical protein
MPTIAISRQNTPYESIKSHNQLIYSRLILKNLPSADGYQPPISLIIRGTLSAPFSPTFGMGCYEKEEKNLLCRIYGQ